MQGPFGKKLSDSTKVSVCIFMEKCVIEARHLDRIIGIQGPKCTPIRTVFLGKEGSEREKRWNKTWC